MTMNRWFVNFANRVAEASGYPSVFVVAVVTVLIWLATGPFFQFSDTWQLVMNTLTSVITFLMVFLIQTSQNRDSTALQAKLDELIRVSTAKNLFVGLEHLSPDEIEEIRTTARQAEQWRPWVLSHIGLIELASKRQPKASPA
jgi:low affinity Fe/Cu permease